MPDLLSYIQDITTELIESENVTSQSLYYELKESLAILDTLHSLHPEENQVIEHTLLTCYTALENADTNHPELIQSSLALFSSNFSCERDINMTLPSTDFSALESILEATDADIIYIQDSVWHAPVKDKRIIANSSHIICDRYQTRKTTPKILIIKNENSEKSTDYKVEIGRSWKLGGQDHGKSSSYMKAEVQDKNGNYASSQISKDKDDDGYNCDVKAGREKKSS